MATNTTLSTASKAAVFRLFANVLAGGLEGFDDDFVPPGLFEDDYIPPDKGPMVFTFSITMAGIATAVVVARILTRTLVLKRSGLGSDDWAIIPATICLLGYTAVHCLGVKKAGLGKHVYDITLHQIEMLLKTIYAHSIIYLTEAFFVKLSILLFYRRLAGPVNPIMHRTINIFIAFIVCYTIASIIAVSWTCRPAYAFWTLSMRYTPVCPGKYALRDYFLSIFGIHVVTDVMILLMPIKMLWRLRMPWGRKVSLLLLFSAGMLACVASILRLIAFPKIITDLDVSWNVIMISFWGQLEAAIAIVTASVPALKPLFSRLNPQPKIIPAENALDHPKRRRPVRTGFTITTTTTTTTATTAAGEDQEGEGGYVTSSGSSATRMGDSGFTEEQEEAGGAVDPEKGMPMHVREDVH